MNFKNIIIESINESIKNSLINEKLKEIMINWKKEKIDSFMYYDNGDIHLSEIKIPKDKRNQGIGTMKIKELINFAQQYNLRITLTPSVDFGATSLTRLKNFYKSLGFKPNKGKYKDFTTRETMIWFPKIYNK
jgi:GNAT superfamily N-acetyltransferase